MEVLLVVPAVVVQVAVVVPVARGVQTGPTDLLDHLLRVPPARRGTQELQGTTVKPERSPTEATSHIRFE